MMKEKLINFLNEEILTAIENRSEVSDKNSYLAGSYNGSIHTLTQIIEWIYQEWEEGE